ncbi:MAG: MATE family efflux transporter [Bacteroidales bacterium]|nr:MATE family efflux transporter [Bacteroidales bacterium]
MNTKLHLDDTNKKRLQALGTEPVGRLLFRFAMPAIVGMAAASLYNIVDAIFIGQFVGTEAINALAIAMPLMVLAAAVGMLVGVGASTLMSVRLGQKDYAAANKILGNVLIFKFIGGILVTIPSLLFLDPLLHFFGASEHTLPYARDFMQIILLFNITSHAYYGLNTLMRSLGKPMTAMWFTISTVVLNIVLAALFIIAFGWGVRGAAAATVLSQIIMLAFQLYLLSNKAEPVHFRREGFQLDRKILTDALAIGMSPFLIHVCACLVVILINNTLVAHGGDTAVGAYGISNRLLYLIITIVIGINQGMQPIAGYNYGAKNIDRLLIVLKHAMLAGTAITTLGFVCFHLFPERLAAAFTDDITLIAMSAHALSSISWSYPIVGAQLVATTFFQCIGYVRQSIFLSLTRQLLFLVPLLLILPDFWGTDGVWYAMPLADILSCLVTSTLLLYHIRKFRTGLVS